MPRRTFLKYLGIVAAGVLGGAGGLAGYRVPQNERDEPYLYTDAELLARIPRDGRQRLFGIYPDLERKGATPWEDVDDIHARVAPVETIGVFATLATFLSEKRIDVLFEQLARIGDRQKLPVLSLGANARGYYDYRHPFDERNTRALEQLAERTAKALNGYSGPLIVRTFFEMNQRPFVYGPGAGLSDAQQQEGFVRSFICMGSAFHKWRKYPTYQVFSPGIQGPIAPYYPRRNGKVYADLIGLDAYDLFPGKGHWWHENYWIYGKESPEEVLLPPLLELLEVSQWKVPVWYWELGSYTRNPQWLRHAALLLFALGGSGLMHFNYDKRSAKKPYETNWMINSELGQMYAETWREVR